jgi:hypothetical protein
MANPKINISSLDFDGIKASLKSYLSTKTEFAGYDFNGSAMNLLLDVLAYNTLFYGYYTNMIANETFLDTAQIESNLIKLTNMLGGLVPNKTSATSTVSVSGSATIYGYKTYLTGSDLTGSFYNFYTIQDVVVSGSSTFTVYEALSAANNLPITVDTTKQTSFLGTDIDSRTVSVKVNGELWTKYDGSTTPNSTSKVFYVARNSDGFYIVFGKKNSTDYASSYGKQITQNDTVTVSYLVPTGSAANNISSITSSVVTVTSSTVTSGGSDSPDLDSVRFSAPKIFAASERAVTEDDYYSLLLTSGLLPASVTTREQLNIWGGDTATPPAPGRIFVSFSDTGITAASTNAANAISFLKAKSIIGTLPEYVQSQPISAYINLGIVKSTSDSVSGITGIIQNYYNSTSIFNNNIRVADMKTTADSSYSNIKSININSLYFVLALSGSDGQKVVNFKNELLPGSTLTYGNSLKTTGFTYSSQTIYLADSPTKFDTSGNATQGVLVGVTANFTLYNNLTNLGYISYSDGYAVIKENVLSNGASIDVTGYPRYPDSTIIKDEFMLTTSFDANITTG